jgi:hypothetical protein
MVTVFIKIIKKLKGTMVQRYNSSEKEGENRRGREWGSDYNYFEII